MQPACLLAKAGDPFLSQWELDLTAKASRILHEGKVNKGRLQEVEADVTRYMLENFSFAVLRFDDEQTGVSSRNAFFRRFMPVLFVGRPKLGLGNVIPIRRSSDSAGFGMCKAWEAKFSLVTRQSASLRPA
jgi:hypothetical protein